MADMHRSRRAVLSIPFHRSTRGRLLTLGLVGGLMLAPAVAQEEAETGIVRLERIQVEGTVIDASQDGAVLLQTEDGLAILVPDDLQVRISARKSADRDSASVDLTKDESMANVLPQPEEMAATPPATADEDLDLAGEVASDDRSDTGIFVLRNPYARSQTVESADGDEMVASPTPEGGEVVANSGVDGRDVELEVGRSEAGTPVNRYDSRLGPGDSVTVVLPDGNAELVALENGLLTLRTESHGLLQMPVEALPQNSLRTVKVQVGEDTVSLQEAMGRERVSIAPDDATAWSPDRVPGGVIAASSGERLLVLAPVRGELELVSVPPVMLAGQAIRLVERDGRVSVEHWAPVAESRPMGEIEGRAEGSSAGNEESNLNSPTDDADVREESNLNSPADGPQPEDPTDQRATDTYQFGTDDEY